MGAPLFDFRHLTPAEHIELDEQLWDTLDESTVEPDDAQIAELRRRRSLVELERDPGEPWQQVIDEIAERRP